MSCVDVKKWPCPLPLIKKNCCTYIFRLKNKVDGWRIIEIHKKKVYPLGIATSFDMPIAKGNVRHVRCWSKAFSETFQLIPSPSIAKRRGSHIAMQRRDHPIRPIDRLPTHCGYTP